MVRKIEGQYQNFCGRNTLCVELNPEIGLGKCSIVCKQPAAMDPDIKPEPDLEDNPFELSESDDEEELKVETSAVKTELITEAIQKV